MPAGTTKTIAKWLNSWPLRGHGAKGFCCKGHKLATKSQAPPKTLICQVFSHQPQLCLQNCNSSLPCNAQRLGNHAIFAKNNSCDTNAPANQLLQQQKKSFPTHPSAHPNTSLNHKLSLSFATHSDNSMMSSNFCEYKRFLTHPTHASKHIAQSQMILTSTTNSDNPMMPTMPNTQLCSDVNTQSHNQRRHLRDTCATGQTTPAQTQTNSFFGPKQITMAQDHIAPSSLAPDPRKPPNQSTSPGGGILATN